MSTIGGTEFGSGESGMSARNDGAAKTIMCFCLIVKSISSGKITTDKTFSSCPYLSIIRIEK